MIRRNPLNLLNPLTLLVRHGRALALDPWPDDPPTPLPVALALLALHLLGLLAVVRLTHHPLWLAWALAWALQPLLASRRLRRPCLLAESFAPLALVYGVLTLRVGLALLARAQGLTSGSLAVPEPWGGLLDLDGAMALSGLWVLLAQSAPTRRALGLPVARASLRELVVRHGRALALDLRLADPPLPLRHTLALLALHAVALRWVVRLTGEPRWPLLATALLIPPLLVSLRRRRFDLLPESLAPLGLAYALLLARLLAALIAHARGLTAGWPLVPAPWDRWLDLGLALTLGGLWTLLAQAGPATEALGRRADWRTALGGMLMALAVAWSVVTGLTLYTRGVTGSDPYAYAQMGVDIAERGTPLHRFAHAPQLAEWRLSLPAAAPVGYRAPDPQTGLAATAWAPGYSALLAVGYRLAGEPALYLLTPLLGLASLAATGLLCGEVLRGWPVGQRTLAAGVAVFVLATSYEQVERQLVPMADVPAQLFTVLTVYCALRAGRGRAWTWAALSGLCLGLAFDIRYTQVLLALPVGVALFNRQERKGREEDTEKPLRPLRSIPPARAWSAWLSRLSPAFVTSALAALPVLWFHQVAFGSPFRTGSEELALFSLASVPRTLVRVGGELFRANEFLFLSPLLVWGALQLWRDARRPAAVLLAWLVAIVPFHLFYDALRLRDLLSVFPLLALGVGVGAALAARPERSEVQSKGAALAARPERSEAQSKGAALAARPERSEAQSKGAGGVRAVLTLLLLAVLLLARSLETLRLPVPPMHFNTFGYLLGPQRAAFDRLAEIVPADGFVAASLNSGPVELYAERAAVRPADWTEDEWLRFVDHALAAGRPVYVLVDGLAMHQSLQTAGGRHALRLVASLPLPYFYPVGGSANRLVALYEVIE